MTKEQKSCVNRFKRLVKDFEKHGLALHEVDGNSSIYFKEDVDNADNFDKGFTGLHMDGVCIEPIISITSPNVG